VNRFRFHTTAFPFFLSRFPSTPVLDDWNDEYFTAAIKAYSLSQHASPMGHHKNWSRPWRIAKI